MIVNLPELFDSARRCNERRWMVRCPAHDDRTPSLSLNRAPDRWLLHCFAGCDTADVLHAYGLSWDDIMDGMSEARPRVARRASSANRIDREPPYPNVHEVLDLWAACEPVDDPRDEAMYAAEWLYVKRRIHPAVVARRDLARVLTKRTPLPPWAFYGRTSWYATGHRLVFPTYDHKGVLRSVRARGVLGHDKKELAPQGVRSSQLVFADVGARHLLEHGAASKAGEIVVCEGATDYLTWASTRRTDDALSILGIASGSWTPKVAASFPDGASVLIDTDDDEAGRRYARAIARSLAGRCELRRYQQDRTARA